MAQIVLRHESFLSGMGQFRQGTFHFFDPGGLQLEREQIGFREIPVIVGFLFRPHGESALFHLIPKPGFLIDAAPLGQNARLPLDLVIQRSLQKAERIEILDFHLRAEGVAPFGPHRDIRVAAQASFFHVAIANAQVQERLAQVGQIIVGFLAAAKIRFAHDLGEGHAAAIEVHVGLPVGIGQAFVEGLPGVFFHMQPGDPENFLAPVHDLSRGRAFAGAHLDAAVLAQRAVVLGNLVSLGEVRVKVILAGENRSRVDRASQGQRRTHGQGHGLPVECGESSRETQADWACVRIGWSAKPGAAAAEELAAREELGMHFQPDNRFKFHYDPFRPHA